MSTERSTQTQLTDTQHTLQAIKDAIADNKRDAMNGGIHRSILQEYTPFGSTRLRDALQTLQQRGDITQVPGYSTENQSVRRGWMPSDHPDTTPGSTER